MSTQFLARALLMIGLSVAIGSYLAGFLQRSPHSHPKRPVAYRQISIRWWRYVVSHVNIETQDVC